MTNKELNLKIEDLFRWKGELNITDNEGNVIETLYQRVVGDADIHRARIQALKSSNLLRKALKDENSDDYLANIPLKEDQTLDAMIAFIIMNTYGSFRDVAVENIKEVKVKEPKSNADLEQQEEYVEKVEEAKGTFEQKVNESIKKQSQELETELRAKSVDEVFNIYVTHIVKYLCNKRMMEVYIEYCTFFGTFSDKNLSEKRFETIEDFRNLASRWKQRLMDSYQNLELGLEEVKK